MSPSSIKCKVNAPMTGPYIRFPTGLEAHIHIAIRSIRREKDATVPDGVWYARPVGMVKSGLPHAE